MKKLLVILIIVLLLPSVSFSKDSPFDWKDYVFGPFIFIGLQIYYFMEDLNAWLKGAYPYGKCEEEIIQDP